LKAILFDLDGTLTDPREGITRSIAYALERMGVAPPPLDDLTFAIGPPLRRSLATLLGDETPVAVERALALYRERFADVGLFENAVYDGIDETLAALGKSARSSSWRPRSRASTPSGIVRHFALDAHFAAVHGCELDGTREDKRDLLAHLLPHHRLAAAAAVMIGDRGADMSAARHHGVRALGALWGYGSREELEGAGAQALCASPRDLPAFI
jgi:phosphoglycolate phosphatase